MKLLKEKQSMNRWWEDEKTFRLASWRIAEELFDVIEQEKAKLGDWDKIPSIDKVLWVIDIT